MNRNIFKNKFRNIVSVVLAAVMAVGLTVPAMAAEKEVTESSDKQIVSFDYGPLTDSEREEFIHEEMERMLGPGAEYRMYFSNEKANEIMPMNDIDEYKTEYTPTKSVMVSGKPGGVLEASLSVSGAGNYIGWTYTDNGGPTKSCEVSFGAQYGIVTFTFSLGKASDKNEYGIVVGVDNAIPGAKYCINRIDKTYDVQAYTIYKKVYDDAGNYTWGEWSGGSIQKVTNRNFDIQKV